MDKIFTKFLFFFLVIAFAAIQTAIAQTITIGTVDPGPYAPGSSISIPISVGGNCVTTATTYNLYLSDASGNFGTLKNIGTFSSFYATFIDGVIPAGTPAGTGYKVEVISSNPAITSTTSAAFTINAGTG